MIDQQEDQEDNDEFVAQDIQDQADQEEAVIETLPDLPGEVAPSPFEISRIDLLTRAIERHPDAPANYVIRGELLLTDGYAELAAQDFVRALELADILAESANWGYIYRALVDRAHEGLRRCQ
ncbi:MAG: hypothetical protein ABI947_08420 [Chloroflexota bacterium]